MHASASAVDTARAIERPQSPATHRPRIASGTWTTRTASATSGSRRCALRDEDERERHRQRDRRDHERRERDDEPADLGADVRAVRRSEQRLDDLGAGDGEDARRRGDDDEREPGRRVDVARDAAGVEPGTGQRHRRDQPERRRGHADDSRGKEVRVAEARHGADAFARGEREADEVDRLQGERQRRSAEQLEQPRPGSREIGSRGAPRASTPNAPAAPARRQGAPSRSSR